MGAAIAVLATAAAILSLSAGGSRRLSPARSAATHQSALRQADQRDTAALRAGRRVSPAALVRLDAIGNATISRLAKLGEPVFCGGPRGDDVAFTFDDGPGPYTYLALRKLEQAHERATFFVVGRSMNAHPGYLPRELKVAAIGDHTYTHPDLVQLPPAEIYSELARTKQQIERQSGHAPDMFRPPYGAIDTTVKQTAEHLGLLPIMWTADSRDSLGANYAGIIHNVEAALHPGAIILMHENRGQTIRALTTILPYLHRRHIRSVSLPELFATDPPSVAQLKRGSAACGHGAGVGAG